MSSGSRPRVEPVPLYDQKYLSEGHILPNRGYVRYTWIIPIFWSKHWLRSNLRPAILCVPRVRASDSAHALLLWKPYFKLSKTTNALCLLLTRTCISSQKLTAIRTHCFFITEILNMKLFSPHESARAGTDWPDPEILPEDQIWMNDWAERLSARERGGGDVVVLQFFTSGLDSCKTENFEHNFSCVFDSMFMRFCLWIKQNIILRGNLL